MLGPGFVGSLPEELDGLADYIRASLFEIRARSSKVNVFGNEELPVSSKLDNAILEMFVVRHSAR